MGDRVRDVQASDLGAFADLIVGQRERLFAIAFHLTGNREDALDAVQDAVVRAMVHIPELRDPEAFPGWIARLVRTSCRECRRRRREEPVTDQTPLPATADSGAGNSMDSLWLRRVLDALPHRQSQLLRDYHIAGMTVRELSRALGRPEGTVKRWLSEARAAAMREAIRMDRTVWLVGDELTTEEREVVRQAAVEAGLAIEQRPDVLEACAAMRGDNTPAAVVLALDERGRGDAWMFLALLRSPASAEHVGVHAVMLGPAMDEVIFTAWKAACAVYLTRPLEPARSPELSRYLSTLVRESPGIDYKAVGGG